MKKKSYSKQIVEAQVMLDGITVHKEKLANRGINDEYIDGYKALIDKCINLNNSQEQAKANMKNLTAELKENMDQLASEYQFCKRGVISNIPKELWNAFGFIFRPRGPKSQKEPDNPPDDTTDQSTSDIPDNVIGYITTIQSDNVGKKKEKSEKNGVK